jgi:transposase
MMGYQPPPPDPLFSFSVQLETRVRTNHPLRKVKEIIKFDFIYDEVADTYGKNGNVSVPPPVILKLMLLLILYNVRSERELMETLPERLDWLWFLGYTIDSPIPDHSVLSKARKRWGKETFRRFFEQVVSQCVKAGLVDGTKLFIDASLIDADASNNSVVNTGSLHLTEGYAELEKRLDEKENDDEESKGRPRSSVNARHVSTTDPDASIVKYGSTPNLYYKTHRAVDPAHEIITAVEVTCGAVNEAHRMLPLIEAHEANTSTVVETVVADSKYGTIENFLALGERKLQGHIPVLKKTHENKGRKEGIFPEGAFTYNPSADTFTCPAGKTMKKRTFHLQRQSTEYRAGKKDCRGCTLRPQCTRSPSGRAVHRHNNKDALDAMLAQATSPSARRDLATRKHLMERSFARGTRYGFDRARWRRLFRVSIQEYLTCAIQNIQVLINAIRNPLRGARGISPLQRLGRDLAYGTRWFSVCLRSVHVRMLPMGWDSAPGVRVRSTY